MEATDRARRRVILYITAAGLANVTGVAFALLLPRTGDGLGDALAANATFLAAAFLGLMISMMALSVTITNRREFPRKLTILVAASFLFPLIGYVLLILVSVVVDLVAVAVQGFGNVGS